MADRFSGLSLAVTNHRHPMFKRTRLMSQVGSGGFGKVYKAEMDGHSGAAKVMSVHSTHTTTEVGILNRIEHPFIVKALGVERTEEQVALLMPFFEGGDLLDRILRLRRLDEREAAHHVAVAALAVKAMHDAGIAHRDIKPENLLLSGSTTVLTDVGSSAVPTVLCESCGKRHAARATAARCYDGAGSVTYAAPEVHERFEFPSRDSPIDESDEGYNPFAADVWSLGVLVYVTTTGRAPWEEPSHWDARYSAHSQGSLAKPRAMSDAAYDFFVSATREAPSDRPTADDLLQHPWLKLAVASAVTSVGGELPALPDTVAEELLIDLYGEEAVGDCECRFASSLEEATSEPAFFGEMEGFDEAVAGDMSDAMSPVSSASLTPTGFAQSDVAFSKTSAYGAGAVDMAISPDDVRFRFDGLARAVSFNGVTVPRAA